MKKILIVFVLTCCLYLYAKDVTEVQSIDASQRNQITGLGGGGGGSGGLTSDTVTNITSATLTVTGQGSNVINIEGGAGGGDAVLANTQTFSGTNSFLKPIYIGTNFTYEGLGYITGEQLLIRPLAGSGNVGVLIDTALGTGDAQLGVSAGNGKYGMLRVNSSGNTELVVGIGDAAFSLQLGGGTTNMFAVSPTSMTLGQNGSSALTVNMSTAAIPNGLNIGSGNLVLPSTGVISNNNSGFFSVRYRKPLPSQITSSTTITPNRDTADVFYCNLTNNPTLAVPTNMRSGETLKLYLKAVNVTNTVSLAAEIRIPSSSTLVSPFTIQTNTTTVLTLGYIGTNYTVEGYIPGYSISPIP